MTKTSEGKLILIVDDEEGICWSLQKAMTRAGHSTAVAASAEEAFDLAARQPPDAIFLDVSLPGMDGLTALGRLRELTDDAPVIVITAFGNLSIAVRAVKEGAFEYLPKPFDLKQALDALERGLQRRALLKQTQARSDDAPRSPEEMIGASPPMQVVFRRIALVAARDACVLITGESGTGKELAARAIHRYSARWDKPFVPVHLAALNPNLVESELFGHVKGAFTGAEQAHMGLLALADGGTLFLDELGDVPLPVQVKLLRVIEHGDWFPVGGNQPSRCNVRILAATHQDLFRKVEQGEFRHDLFFRLNVFQIHLPPLRERTEDIPRLADHFLKLMGMNDFPLPQTTLEHLLALPWPGNVRELRNALEHGVILAQGGPLLTEHFPSPLAMDSMDQVEAAVRRWLSQRLTNRPGSLPPDNLYQEFLQLTESPFLREIMRRVNGNRVQAARWLGLNRATVRKKLAEYGLDENPSNEPDQVED